MRAVIDYVFIGLITLALTFLTTPMLIDFYAEAISGVDNASELESNEQSLVTAVLLLLVLAFYLFLVYMFYAAVQQRIDDMQ